MALVNVTLCVERINFMQTVCAWVAIKSSKTGGQNLQNAQVSPSGPDSGATWHPHQTPSLPRSGGEGRGEEALGKTHAASPLKNPSPQPSPRASLRGEGVVRGAGAKLRPWKGVMCNGRLFRPLDYGAGVAEDVRAQRPRPEHPPRNFTEPNRTPRTAWLRRLML